MYTYLSSLAANYNYTLTLPCHKILPIDSDKAQIVHKFDDGGVDITRMSDQSYFDILIDFQGITTTNAAILWHLWHNPLYANGRARTFYWANTMDAHYYTVRFMDRLKRTFNARYISTREDITAVLFRVEGNKPA